MHALSDHLRGQAEHEGSAARHLPEVPRTGHAHHLGAEPESLQLLEPHRGEVRQAQRPRRDHQGKGAPEGVPEDLAATAGQARPPERCENRAGNSTLMRVLYGFWQPDTGTISVDGKRLDLRSPSDAIRAGIGMVFQSFMLIPAFSVAENIALTLPGSGVLLSVSAIRARLREFGSRYGLSVDADAKVWQLSVGE